MVSKAWIRHKKNERDPLDEHWIVTLPRAPEGNDPWMICVEEQCKGWTPAVVVTCVYGFCNETYCGVCGRAGGSWGPAGCPCDGATKGHNTLAERPRARGKVVVNQDTDSDGFAWPIFRVIPFKKHKKTRGKRR